MASLLVTRVSKAGIPNAAGALDPADVAGDDVVSASGLLIVMENKDVGAHTLTVAAPSATADCGNLGELAVEDITLVVAAGEFGFLTIPAGYADASNNFAWTYDDVTSLAIGVFSLAP